MDIYNQIKHAIAASGVGYFDTLAAVLQELGEKAPEKNQFIMGICKHKASGIANELMMGGVDIARIAERNK